MHYSGPERRLFSHSDSAETQPVSVLCLRRHSIQIPSSAIRFISLHAFLPNAWSQQGIQCLDYLDDLLILAYSAHQANTHTSSLIAHLQSLGFVINRENSCLTPSQEVCFLGLELNSIENRARSSGNHGPVGLAPEREKLMATRLPTNVIHTRHNTEC